jgi:hypothetical protein
MNKIKPGKMLFFLKRKDMSEEKIKEMELEDEMKRFEFLTLIKNSNPLLNLLSITSILFPRHARCTLFYLNIVLIWFWCAMMYKNSKNPLILPDYVSVIAIDILG